MYAITADRTMHVKEGIKYITRFFDFSLPFELVVGADRSDFAEGKNKAFIRLNILVSYCSTGYHRLPTNTG